MYCAAGMKKPVTAIAEQYEEEYGVPVELHFGGSGTLLASLDIGKGDIYLAADSSYTNLAKEKGHVKETIPVALMRAGFGVPKGNPKGFSKLADVKNPDLKIGIGNPDAASIGKFTKKVLSKHGIWDGFEPAVLFPTVNELANSVKLGTIDAGIIWDAMAAQYPDLDFVNVPEFDAEKKDITVGVLTDSEQPTEALKFCRYLTAKDKGLKIFGADGYEPVENADEWAETPEIALFSGAMLRPAIEKTITKFEEREGVKINPTYNGCGILVAQMKAGQNPDAYFSCDVTFMTMVQERFSKPITVSANEMVILVRKGNPHKVFKLEDLKNEGLKVGFSHPEKSALGALTKRMLEDEGLYEEILATGNVIPASATGDFLVNQIRSNSLDAVIVYKSNAMANPGSDVDVDIIQINRPNAVAEQPFAVGQGSPYPNLVSRFFEACVSEAGKEDFLKYGFRWELVDEES
ncbi:MAG: molybdate ABC transporter substrate-binding protein [Verrucomicrobiales bacterium]|nr:molybdate ABC transporter substrate-binding protein [Verrucomicrobiales bacterium]